MSYFEKLAMEGADLGYENDAPLANGEETHTVANEIAEVQGLAQEAADAEEGAEKLDDEAAKTEELADNVEADVAAENILDPTAAKFMRLAFKNIVGAKYADKKLPATESWSGSRSQARENTRIALEGIKDTLKSFWEAIKAQFKKVYAKVKSWIVKTFSAAKKLKERAEKLQKKANDTVGTIEEKSFSFGQTKAIAIDGKYSDAGSLTKNFSVLANSLAGSNGVLNRLKKSKVDDAVEGMVNGFADAFTKFKNLKGDADITVNNATPITNFLAGFADLKAVAGAALSDDKLIEMYSGESKSATTKDMLVTWSGPLTGGKAIYLVSPKNGASMSGGVDIDDLTKFVKGCRIVIGNDKYTPREVSEGDVKTLTTSQIDKVCDDVIEIAEEVYDYEKEWANRDKLVSKVEKELDDIVKEFDDSDDDSSSKVQGAVRKVTQACIGSLRRLVSFEANLCSYALTTSNAFLNYAERSLSQHKSK